MDLGFFTYPDLGFKSPLIILCDLSDGFDKVLEEPDQNKTVLRVLDMKNNIFFNFFPSFRTFYHGSGFLADPDPD